MLMPSLLNCPWCGSLCDLVLLRGLCGVGRLRTVLDLDFRGAIFASHSGYMDRLGVRDPRIPRDPDLQHAVAQPGFQPVRVGAEREGYRASKLSVGVLEVLELESLALLRSSDLPRSGDLEQALADRDLNGIPRDAGDIQGDHHFLLAFPERDRRTPLAPYSGTPRDLPELLHQAIDLLLDVLFGILLRGNRCVRLVTDRRRVAARHGPEEPLDLIDGAVDGLGVV